MITILLTLVGFHFLCDYPLQGDFLARGKGSFKEPLYGVPWYHCMTAHAGIHGLAVGLVTGCVWLGLLESCAHFVIDYTKCRKWTGIDTDQVLHVVCKVIWVGILYGST